MLKPYSLEQWLKRKKEHKAWEDYTPFEKWWNWNSGMVYFWIGLAVFTAVMVVPSLFWDEMDTWTIIDKDTGIRYENARYASHNTCDDCGNGNGWSSECEDNPKPIYGYEPFQKKETNNPEPVNNPLYLKVGEQYITLQNWEKIDFKVVNQRKYCKNIGEFAVDETP